MSTSAVYIPNMMAQGGIIMTEKEKMLAGQDYDSLDVTLTADRDQAATLLGEYNRTTDRHQPLRQQLLTQLLGQIGKNVFIRPPFLVDYGYNIEIGDDVYVNFGLTVLDCNRVHIGNRVLIGPNVQLYAVTHPLNAKERMNGLESSRPISIGNDVWIGGNVIIVQGVTIGSGTTIGAGSVVTKDIPSNVLAAGNPCKVLRRLDEE